MPPLRVYTDTSVIGGCLDHQFSQHSLRMIDSARRGLLTLLISDVVQEEVARAPREVQEILVAVDPRRIEFVPISPEVIQLRDAYLAAGIVGSRWREDATHVAAAAVSKADAIVSWNFRHIVRLDRIKAYNAVNVQCGHPLLTIITPRELPSHEFQDQDI